MSRLCLQKELEKAVREGNEKFSDMMTKQMMAQEDIRLAAEAEAKVCMHAIIITFTLHGGVVPHVLRYVKMCLSARPLSVHVSALYLHASALPRRKGFRKVMQGADLADGGRNEPIVRNTRVYSTYQWQLIPAYF